MEVSFSVDLLQISLYAIFLAIGYFVGWGMLSSQLNKIGFKLEWHKGSKAFRLYQVDRTQGKVFQESAVDKSKD